MVIAGVLVAIIALAMAYVRLAPTDVGRWHVDIAGPSAPTPGPCVEKIVVNEGSAQATCLVTLTPEQVLQRLDQIALATPRTIRLAGSAQEGRITWQTRSALWGFPDQTTAQAVETAGVTRLDILGRLRFGRGDMGVNAARLKAWLSQL